MVEEELPKYFTEILYQLSISYIYYIYNKVYYIRELYKLSCASLRVITSYWKK